MVGVSFIGKERDLRINKRWEEFHILREISMERGSMAMNGRSHSYHQQPETTSSLSWLLVREDSPPLLGKMPEEDQRGFS